MARSFDPSLGESIYVDDANGAITICNDFLKLSHIAFDTETTGLDKQRDQIVLFSLSDGVSRFTLPRHCLRYLAPVFVNPNIVKICHNIKYDAHMLENAGIPLMGDFHDTVVMAGLTDENRSLRLKDIFSRTTSMHTENWKGLMDKFKKAGLTPKRDATVITIMTDIMGKIAEEEPLSEAEEFCFDVLQDYASQDALLHWRLWDTERRRLQDTYFGGEDWTGWDFFLQIAVPFTKTLFNIERRGFALDLQFLKQLEKPLKDEIDEVARQFAKKAGREWNLASSKQMLTFFYELLGYKKMVIRGKEQETTSKDALERWIVQKRCDYSKLLLEHRKRSKILGTYVLGLQENSYEGRIHTSLNQTGAKTGRLSSSGPNLQNIPNRGTDKLGLRKAFVASRGKRLIVADYAQVEMRIFAHYSNDQNMLDAINNGKDLHADTAARMFGLEYEQIVASKKKAKADLTEEDNAIISERSKAKTINFGILYGMSSFGLQTTLATQHNIEVDEEEAKGYLDQYFIAYPGAAAWIKQVEREVSKNQCVQTILGRYRRLPDAKIGNYKQRARAKRQAVNAIIQGSAGDVINVTMNSLEYDTNLKRLQVRQLLQIHDELVFELPDNDYVAEEASKIIRYIMEHPFEENLSVPLLVDMDQGYDWSEAK